MKNIFAQHKFESRIEHKTCFSSIQKFPFAILTMARHSACALTHPSSSRLAVLIQEIFINLQFKVRTGRERNELSPRGEIFGGFRSVGMRDVEFEFFKYVKFLVARENCWNVAKNVACNILHRDRLSK
jgi:hypothetical protein